MTNKNKEEKEILIKTDITVIDSLMGTGKTSWAIKYMRERGTAKAPLGNISPSFIYVTPFLDEASRIRTELPELHFIEPTTKNSKGSKLESLKILLNAGENICTTHALLQRCDGEVLALLQKMNYILILDEVIDVVDSLELPKDDWGLMLETGILKLEDNWVKWNKGTNYNGRLSEYKELCYFNNVYQYRNKDYIWSFPVSIFKAFTETFILTYMFDGSLLKYFFDYHKLGYELKSIHDGELVSYMGIGDTSQIKLLLNIYSGKMNLIGEGRVKNGIDYTLSATHLLEKVTVEELDTLQRHIKNYFNNVVDVTAKKVIISTFKEVFEKLTNKESKAYRYRNSFVAVNSRATNQYKDRTAIAYIANRFQNPWVSGFFRELGVDIDEDKLALAELVQCIWRSAIREGKKVNLFIPSKRMRGLLESWLNMGT